MDMAWKRMERETAGYFGTQRALHGIDRDQGEVQTDIFVDGKVWNEHTTGRLDFFEDYAVFVECKYTKDGSSSNAWMVHELAAINKETGVKNTSCVPVLVTKDGWHWFQLQHFEEYMKWIVRPSGKPNPDTVLHIFEVRHVNRGISSFFESAIAQARAAVLPRRMDDSSYSHRLHVVCVGTNARIPKCIGVPPNALLDLRTV